MGHGPHGQLAALEAAFLRRLPGVPQPEPKSPPIRQSGKEGSEGKDNPKSKAGWRHSLRHEDARGFGSDMDGADEAPRRANKLSAAAARGISERGALLYWASVLPLKPLARSVLEARVAIALAPAAKKADLLQELPTDGYIYRYIYRSLPLYLPLRRLQELPTDGRLHLPLRRPSGRP